LLLLSYKAMEIVSNGVTIPVTKPCLVMVLVSAFVALLRFKCSQLASFSSLSLLINKYSNSIVITTNLRLYIAVTF